MPRFDHHTDPSGVDRGEDFLRNLFRQSLLQLQPPGVHVDEPCELRHAEYAAAGNVADVAAAEKRQHVVLAQAVYLDILYDHHAVSGLREYRAVDQTLRI